MTKKKYLLAILIFTFFLNGCSGETDVSTNGDTIEKNSDTSIRVEGESYPLIVRDVTNEEVLLEEKPQRVAVISGTPLNIWYDLGGKSICTSDVSESVKLVEEYKGEILDLPTIGPVYSVNMEAIIGMEPDLIIAQLGVQTSQINKLREMGYKVISTNIRSYDDVTSTYRAFGKILEEEALAEEKIDSMNNKTQEILAKLPDENPSVVILYVTSRSMAVKLDNSIAGDVANILNLNNIASGLPPDTIGSENTPIDIEYIVGKDPDYVLVTSMVSNNELAKEMMTREFEENPAWRGVSAISEGRVIYLPQEYFLYNAGPYYHEAIEYIAKAIYPEIYGELENN